MFLINCRFQVLIMLSRKGLQHFATLYFYLIKLNIQSFIMVITQLNSTVKCVRQGIIISLLSCYNTILNAWTRLLMSILLIISKTSKIKTKQKCLICFFFRKRNAWLWFCFEIPSCDGNPVEINRHSFNMGVKLMLFFSSFS